MFLAKQNETKKKKKICPKEREISMGGSDGYAMKQK